jgi:xanthine dehydrogenase accessory factor
MSERGARAPGDEILRRAGELEDLGEPYVLATVVAVDRPVSARPGDRAVITAEPRLEGWVGGSCSEPIVLREAVAALSDGEPRLVCIRPSAGGLRHERRPGVVVEVTTCASDGGLDVFVEPRLPRPHLVVAGSSPVSRALADLAKRVGYRVTAVLDAPAEQVPGADDRTDLQGLARSGMRPQDAVVVATMNRYDETALEAALGTQAGYVGLVASHARGESVVAILRARGEVSAVDLERVRWPAGLDIGSSRQEEIAVAILAEVVAHRHRLADEGPGDPLCPEDEIAHATDPVCGMKVVASTAVSIDYGGSTLYFCSPGCRDRFVEAPDAYSKTAGA